MAGTATPQAHDLMSAFWLLKRIFILKLYDCDRVPELHSIFIELHSITTVYCNYLYLEVQHRSREVKTCLVVFLRGIFFVKLIDLCFVSAKNLIAALLQVKKRKRLSVDKALNHE